MIVCHDCEVGIPKSQHQNLNRNGKYVIMKTYQNHDRGWIIFENYTNVSSWYEGSD